MTTELETVTESQTLTDAGELMTETAIKSVIVSDADDRPVGILTSTDFVRMAAESNTPTECTVGEFMSGEIVTTTADTSVREAADLMVENNISHLPVVNDDGRLAGIVTTTDVAAYVSGLSELLPE